MESVTSYPIYAEGTAKYSEDSGDFICYVCPVDTVKLPLEQHLKDENHLIKLHDFTRSIVKMAAVIHHTMAPKPIDFGKIIEDALRDSPEEAPKIMFRNFISKREDEYYCHLCALKLPFWFSVESHCSDSKHQVLRTRTIDISILENLSCSIIHYRLRIENSIFMKTVQSMFCYLCHCDVEPTYNDVITHIESQGHVNERQRPSESQKSSETCHSRGDHSEVESSGKDSEQDEDETEIEDFEFILSSPAEFNDSIGNRGIDKGFELDDDDGTNVKGSDEKSTENDVPKEVEQEHQNLPKGITYVDDKFACSACQCHNMPHLKNVEEHVKGARHRKNTKIPEEDSTGNDVPKEVVQEYRNLPKWISYVDEKFACSACQRHNMPNLKTVEDHVKGARHRKNTKIPEEESTENDVTKEVEQARASIPIVQEDQSLPTWISYVDDKFACSACQSHDMSCLKTVKEHVKGAQHRKKTKIPQEIISVDTTHFKCSLCKCEMSGEITAWMHGRGLRHQKAVERLQELQMKTKKSTTGRKKKAVPGLSSSTSRMGVKDLKRKGTAYSFVYGLVEITGRNFIACAICDNHAIPLTDFGIAGHLNGKTHRRYLAKLLNTTRSK